MKEVEKKQAPEVSGGHSGPLGTQWPPPIGPMPTVPPIPPSDDVTGLTDQH